MYQTSFEQIINTTFPRILPVTILTTENFVSSHLYTCDAISSENYVDEPPTLSHMTTPPSFSDDLSTGSNYNQFRYFSNEDRSSSRVQTCASAAIKNGQEVHQTFTFSSGYLSFKGKYRSWRGNDRSRKLQS